jgi:hypothetical protein
MLVQGCQHSEMIQRRRRKPATPRTLLPALFKCNVSIQHM